MTTQFQSTCQIDPTARAISSFCQPCFGFAQQDGQLPFSKLRLAKDAQLPFSNPRLAK